jgi:hypothetical protein
MLVTMHVQHTHAMPKLVLLLFPDMVSIKIKFVH